MDDDEPGQNNDGPETEVRKDQILLESAALEIFGISSGFFSLVCLYRWGAVGACYREGECRTGVTRALPHR